MYVNYINQVCEIILLSMKRIPFRAAVVVVVFVVVIFVSLVIVVGV